MINSKDPKEVQSTLEKNKNANDSNNSASGVIKEAEKAYKIAEEVGTEIKNNLSDIQKSVSDFIKENPMLTLSISMFIGICVGGLLRK